MIVWWVFLGACVLIFMIYDAIFKAPERKAQAEEQAQWEHQHFNGWRLEQKYPLESEIEHGIFYDRLEHKSCTTKGYPGYDACPSQLYYANGAPSTPPVEMPAQKPLKKKR